MRSRGDVMARARKPAEKGPDEAVEEAAGAEAPDVPDAFQLLQFLGC
jgi:hypothetical protein